MALLQELNEVPGGDSFADLYAKYDLLTQTINSILGGGLSGQFPVKVDGTDFNFQFIDQSPIKFKSVNIGTWDMDITTNKSVVHGVDPEKIRIVYAIIRDDSGTTRVSSEFFNAAAGVPSGSGGNIVILNTSILITRITGGTFDTTSWNDASINRGYITIGYID